MEIHQFRRIIKITKATSKKIIVLPMYPQYCAATTGSTFDEVTNFCRNGVDSELRFINQYFEEKNILQLYQIQ